MGKITFEVEYDERPILHAYVKCPKCGRKYNAKDIIGKHVGSPRYYIASKDDLLNCFYQCPVCKEVFKTEKCREGSAYPAHAYLHEIVETKYPECSEGAYRQRTVWECK